MTTPDAMTEHEVARADVDEARQLVEHLRHAVAQGNEGHASLATAEYKLNVALRRLDEANGKGALEP